MNEIVVRRVRELLRLDRRRTSTRAAASGSTAAPAPGKTTLAMLVSRTALEAGRSVAIYSLPQAPGADPPDLRRRDRRAVLLRPLRAARDGRPAPRRRPRRREPHRMGAGAALRAGQRALRGAALPGRDHQPRGAASSRSRSGPASSPAWSRCAATPCRSSTRTARAISADVATSLGEGGGSALGHGSTTSDRLEPS